MALDIDASPTNQIIALVTFTWGNSTLLRYCAAVSDLTISPHTFTAVPELEITPGKQDGGTTDQPYQIIMPSTLPPAATLKRIYAHANVRCSIQTWDPSDGTTIREVFVGDVVGVTLNPSGRTGLVKLDIAGVKALLDASFGIIATTTCAWTFCDKSCGLLVADLQESRNVVSLTGRVLEVDALSMGSHVDWYREGWVTFDDLTIKIADYPAADNKLTMQRLPPPEWVGAAVTVMPGCDKTVDQCGHDKWNNLERRVALGEKMLSYDPRYQSP